MTSDIDGVAVSDRNGSRWNLGEFCGVSGRVCALFFTAQWCPDCREVLPGFVQQYDANFGSDAKTNSGSSLAVIIVPSDNTPEEFVKNQTRFPSSWYSVPFEESHKLKVAFQVCAQKEQSKLKIKERKYGIPTLVVFNRNTTSVKSFQGIQDIHKYGLQKAFEIWNSK